jgi:hypothetical protein
MYGPLTAMNFENGHPCTLYEATRYTTFEEAKDVAEGLMGVDTIELITEPPYSDSQILSFLLKQFKPHSLKMNGESDWVFINTGFPMNAAKGQTPIDAVIAAMRANENF